MHRPWHRQMWALAMNAGTQAAKEAANMVDLDSDSHKADRSGGSREQL